jgi:hypothetical protein
MTRRSRPKDDLQPPPEQLPSRLVEKAPGPTPAPDRTAEQPCAQISLDDAIRQLEQWQCLRGQAQ